MARPQTPFTAKPAKQINTARDKMRMGYDRLRRAIKRTEGDCQKFCVRDFCEGGFKLVVAIENETSEAWSDSLLSCSERSSPKAA